MIELRDNQKYTVLGLMSGTSLDGLDLALCQYECKDECQAEIWSYKILKVQTIAYPDALRAQLAKSMLLSGTDLLHLDHVLGRYFGQACQDFLKDSSVQPMLIASHGHTIFHRPDQGWTCQIGHGAHIYSQTNIPVAYDFRMVDMALGGQGAPLVPMGDQSLFPQAQACLNLGGIANISFQHVSPPPSTEASSKVFNNPKTSDTSNASNISNTSKTSNLSNIKAFDIAPCNMVLNQLASEIGLEYDSEGYHASMGIIDISLLNALNDLDFYTWPAPKSLGKEWVDQVFFPVLNRYKHLSVEDRLASVCEHIAFQLQKTLTSSLFEGNLLVTGGGALNTFLVEKMRQKLNLTQKLWIPDHETICFKEALIFGFLGLLRVLGKPNCLASVTGAKQDNLGGSLIGFPTVPK